MPAHSLESAPAGRRSLRRAGPVALLMLVLVCAAAPAGATLGGPLASVESDRMALQAHSRHTEHAAFTLHEITLPNRGVVREYVSPAGQVFAVTWHGPFLPNMEQLMGAHLQAIRRASHTQRGGLGHFAASTDEVSFVNNGRMRSFHGAAYLIHGIPSGASVHDIQ